MIFYMKLRPLLLFWYIHIKNEDTFVGCHAKNHCIISGYSKPKLIEILPILLQTFFFLESSIGPILKARLNTSAFKKNPKKLTAFSFKVWKTVIEKYILVGKLSQFCWSQLTVSFSVSWRIVPPSSPTKHIFLVWGSWKPDGCEFAVAVFQGRKAECVITDTQMHGHTDTHMHSCHPNQHKQQGITSTHRNAHSTHANRSSVDGLILFLISGCWNGNSVVKKKKKSL